MEELSERLGVSKSHLVRMFTAALGIPPGRYLTKVRVEAAMRLLLHREYTLDVIASLCGFSGANYLCRVFKKETGHSPRSGGLWPVSPSAPASPRRRASASRSSTFKSILSQRVCGFAGPFLCGVHLVIRLFHGVVDIFKSRVKLRAADGHPGQDGIPARKCP